MYRSPLENKEYQKLTTKTLTYFTDTLSLGEKLHIIILDKETWEKDYHIVSSLLHNYLAILEGIASLISKSSPNIIPILLRTFLETGSFLIYIMQNQTKWQECTAAYYIMHWHQYKVSFKFSIKQARYNLQKISRSDFKQEKRQQELIIAENRKYLANIQRVIEKNSKLSEYEAKKQFLEKRNKRKFTPNWYTLVDEKVVNFHDLLRKINKKELYRFYRQFSQAVHSATTSKDTVTPSVKYTSTSVISQYLLFINLLTQLVFSLLSEYFCSEKEKELFNLKMQELESQSKNLETAWEKLPIPQPAGVPLTKN